MIVITSFNFSNLVPNITTMYVCRVCTSNVACRYREKGGLADELRDIIETAKELQLKRERYLIIIISKYNLS